MTADRPYAARALRLVLGAGLVVSLAANLPGHMSLDSVNALYEARSGVQITWAPVAYAWILGLFDDALAGTSLYVTASSVLLFGALMLLPTLRRRTCWLAVPVALAAVLTPQLLIYQGIVWRDVLFANLSVAGFVLLAMAAGRWAERPPWLLLAGALAMLAVAATVRQNGLILTVMAGVVVGWLARGRGWRAVAAWTAGWIVAALLVAVAVTALATPHQRAPGLRPDAGIRILEHYDVVGAAAHDPSIALDRIAASNPDHARKLRADAIRYYTPERVDTLDNDPAFRRSLWRTPDAVMAAQWREVILRHPRAYLTHRLRAFRQVLATPRLTACLPYQVGVSGPAQMISDLNLQAGEREQDRRLAHYANRLLGTPVYSHLTYAAIAVVLIALLAWRRSPQDVVMIGLLGGALAFTASFLAISIACDYRYLYLLDLAAITGLIYFALDPDVRRA
jgi:hypothetical protein